jgi:threonine/homoserine/homoserine lactone efflux protein
MTRLALLWYSAVACLLSLGPFTTVYLNSRRWIDRTAGAIFIAFGARLAADR